MISLSEAGVEVAVRGDRQAEVAGQALAGLHDGQKLPDVGSDGRRYPAGQHGLEMTPRQSVLTLEKEGPRESPAAPVPVPDD